MHRVGVRGGHDVGSGGMDLRVDHERCDVERPVALDDLAPIVHEQQVLHPDLLEVHAQRVDPEVVEQLGVPGGDVTGHALVETEVPEQAERGGEPLLAVATVVLDVVEHRAHVRGAIRDHAGSVNPSPGTALYRSVQ